MTVIDTGISTGYGRDWTPAHAVREVLQNYLDVKTEYGVSGSIRYAGGKVTVKDAGPGISMRHLAMGVSEKGSHTIGTFGEGLKMAFLVLAREKRYVRLRTEMMAIRPYITRSLTYQTETLHLEITPIDLYVEGTTVTVECSEEELAAGKAYFEDLVKVKKVAEGMSLPAGNIFVNGSRVATIDRALFSYHLEGESAKKILNRDRDTVNQYELAYLVTRIVEKVKAKNVIAAILQNALNGGFAWETVHLYLDGDRVEHKEVWQQVFRAGYPDAVIASRGDSINRQAEYRGFRLLHGVPYYWEDFLKKAIGVKTAEDALVGEDGVQPIAANLSPEHAANLQWAIETIERHYKKIPVPIMVIENMHQMIGAAEGGQFVGLASGNEIYLNADAMHNRKSLLGILLHEVVHVVSGATDLTAAFEEALLAVSVKMMMEAQK